MKSHPAPQPDPGDYAALRRGGDSPGRTRAQLGLTPPQAARLEAVFRRVQARGAGDSQLPKFARDEAHVAAVLKGGGFPALPAGPRP